VYTNKHVRLDSSRHRTQLAVIATRRLITLALVLRGGALALLAIAALGATAAGPAQAKPIGPCDGPCPPPRPKKSDDRPRGGRQGCDDCSTPRQKLVTVYRNTRAYSTPYLNARSSHEVKPGIYVATCEANSGSRDGNSNPWWSRMREGTWVNNGYLKGGAKMGIGDCASPPNDAQPSLGGRRGCDDCVSPPPPPPRGGRQGCDDCRQPPSPKSPAVAATYVTAMTRGFGDVPVGATRILADTGVKTRDDGVIVVKFFIPNRKAAAGVLRGDDRSWSSDPATATRSRVYLTWDVATGKVAATVSASYVAGGGRPFPALRIDRKSRCGDVQSTDLRSRATNDLYVGRDGAGLRVCMSALNSFTSRWDVGALSVDGALSIAPNSADPSNYDVAFNGNGYPAIEAYYYPRTSPIANTLFLRRVDPAGLGASVDQSGGLGALDLGSYWWCFSAKGRKNDLKSTCGFDPRMINNKRQHDHYDTRLGDSAG
jgi:hypothetical protein